MVTERVLNLWNVDVTDYWIKSLWKEKAKELFVKNALKLNKKSYNYWCIIFDVEKNLKNKKSIYEQMKEPVFSRFKNS